MRVLPTVSDLALVCGLLLALGGLARAGVVCDGVDDRLTGTNEAQFDCTNTTCSYSFWMQTAATTGGVFSKESSNGYVLFAVSSSRLDLVIYEASSSIKAGDRTTSTGLADGNWHHVLVVFTTSTTVTNSNTITLYVDGALNQGTLFHAGTVGYGPNNAVVTLCGRGATAFVNARLDAVQVFPSDVSTFVALLSQSNLRTPGLPVAITATLPMTEVEEGTPTPNGTVFADRSGNNNTFTANTGANTTGLTSDVSGARLMMQRGVE